MSVLAVPRSIARSVEKWLRINPNINNPDKGPRQKRGRMVVIARQKSGLRLLLVEEMGRRVVPDFAANIFARFWPGSPGGFRTPEQPKCVCEQYCPLFCEIAGFSSA